MEKSEAEIVAIAQVVHEANRAWCSMHGDNSQLPWAQAENWQRDSAVEGVKFALANPDAPASAQHDAWSCHKIADGWRYGEVKDPVAKTHPCLVPFDKLPKMQQAKDRMFKAIVNALAVALIGVFVAAAAVSVARADEAPNFPQMPKSGDSIWLVEVHTPGAALTCMGSYRSKDACEVAVKKVNGSLAKLRWGKAACVETMQP